jgi:hypothetical protein
MPMVRRMKILLKILPFKDDDAKETLSHSAEEKSMGNKEKRHAMSRRMIEVMRQEYFGENATDGPVAQQTMFRIGEEWFKLQLELYKQKNNWHHNSFVNRKILKTKLLKEKNTIFLHLYCSAGCECPMLWTWI